MVHEDGMDSGVSMLEAWYIVGSCVLSGIESTNTGWHINVYYVLHTQSVKLSIIGYGYGAFMA